MSDRKKAASLLRTSFSFLGFMFHYVKSRIDWTFLSKLQLRRIKHFVRSCFRGTSTDLLKHFHSLPTGLTRPSNVIYSIWGRGWIKLLAFFRKRRISFLADVAQKSLLLKRAARSCGKKEERDESFDADLKRKVKAKVNKKRERCALAYRQSDKLSVRTIIRVSELCILIS